MVIQHNLWLDVLHIKVYMQRSTYLNTLWGNLVRSNKYWMHILMKNCCAMWSSHWMVEYLGLDQCCPSRACLANTYNSTVHMWIWYHFVTEATLSIWHTNANDLSLPVSHYLFKKKTRLRFHSFYRSLSAPLSSSPLLYTWLKLWSLCNNGRVSACSAKENPSNFFFFAPNSFW